MKNFVLSLAIISLLAITSCGEDSPVNPGDILNIGLDGTVTYNGESYAIKNGFFSQQERDGTAEAQFFLADGIITPSTNGVSPGESEVVISVTAFSRGTSVITDGEYATSTDVPDQYAFVTVTTFEGGTQNKQSFTNGTVSISGSNNTYTLTFDVPFGQGIELTGSVSGTYVDPTSI